MLEGFVPYPDEFVDRYRSRGLWLDRPLWELFAQKFQAFADRPAIVYAGTTLTYCELGERSVGLARALAELGISALDRVVLQLPNIPELVLAYFALQRLGAIPIMALPARRPYTIRGYFRAPEHNATAFTPDGFYRTGDLVRMHPSRNLIVAGRKKDLINRGGEKISAERWRT